MCVLCVEGTELHVQCICVYESVFLTRSPVTAVTWECIDRIPSKVSRDSAENLVYIFVGMANHEEAEMDLEVLY